MRKIAVTGSLASGKSTVCKILEKQGAYQVDADEIIHQILSTNKACIEKVVKLLGTDILTDQKIDRKKVANLVFNNPDKLKALEELLHPLLFEEIEKIYEELNKQPHCNLFVAEIPILFEIGKENLFDEVVVVISDKEIAKKRYAKEDFERRIQRQLDPKTKAQKADYTIVNNGSLKELSQAVMNYLSTRSS